MYRQITSESVTGEYKHFQHCSENSWLSLFKEGNERVFQEIFDEHKVVLYSYALKLLNYNVAEAEDMTALAFARLWHNRQGMESRAHIRGWLYMVVRNAIIDSNIRKRRRAKVVRFDDPNEIASDGNSLDMERMHAEMIAIVTAEVERLPARQRDVFKLLFFDRKSGKEVATQLGLSESGVTRDKQKAQDFLRAVLQKNGFSAAILTLLYFCHII